jgi:hypothetical protein
MQIERRYHGLDGVPAGVVKAVKAMHLTRARRDYPL